MLSGYISAMVLATFVGLALGALGGGGSIVTTPLLVYVARIPPEIAIGMSLMIVGTTSFIGAALHLRRGNLALKPAILFSMTGTIGSFLGSTGTHLLSRRSLLLLFSGVMLIVGIAMWRRKTFRPRLEGANTGKCLTAGFVLGLLTGFLGIGGGFLIVPSLMLFAGLDTRHAAGTSLAVIAFNSVTGLLGQLRYVQIDWSLLSGFLLFTVAGMFAGSKLSGRISELQLRRLFAVVVLVLGTAVGIENLFP